MGCSLAWSHPVRVAGTLEETSLLFWPNGGLEGYFICVLINKAFSSCCFHVNLYVAQSDFKHSLLKTAIDNKSNIPVYTSQKMESEAILFSVT